MDRDQKDGKIEEELKKPCDEIYIYIYIYKEYHASTSILVIMISL